MNLKLRHPFKETKYIKILTKFSLPAIFTTKSVSDMMAKQQITENRCRVEKIPLTLSCPGRGVFGTALEAFYS